MDQSKVQKDLQTFGLSAEDAKTVAEVLKRDETQPRTAEDQAKVTQARATLNLK